MSDNKLGHYKEIRLDKMRFRPAYKIDFLVRAMLDQGIAPERILEHTGLDRLQLQYPDTRIAMSDLVKVYANVQKYSNDPAIALKVGVQIDSGCYGVYGHALLNYPTIRQALNFSIEFHSIVTRTVRMELVEEPDNPVASLRFYDLLHEPQLFRFNIEFQLGIVLALFRDMMGEQNLSFKQARVAYPPPVHAAQYGELLQCPVIFSQPQNEYLLDKKLLNARLPRANAFALRALLKACEAEFKEWCEGDGLLITVRKIIRENLDADSSAELVAARLNMTSRTLRRHLAERSTSFREILGKLRIEVAQHHLISSQMSIDAIAALVGYSDTTNFRHAFKRWAGITPGQYRKGVQGTVTLRSQ